MYFLHKFLSQFLGFDGFFRAFRKIFPSKMPHCTYFICPIYKIRIGVLSVIPSSSKVYLKTKKMTNISQAQAGFKANSRRNPLWISRLFNAKSSCACRNRLNFRLFRYTLDKNTVVSLLYRFPAKMQLPCRNGWSFGAVFVGIEAHFAQRRQQCPQGDRGERAHDKAQHQHDRRVVQRQR